MESHSAERLSVLSRKHIAGEVGEVTYSRAIRSHTPEVLTCHKCGKPYTLGEYDVHVRYSPSHEHDTDRIIRVDMTGQAYRANPIVRGMR